MSVYSLVGAQYGSEGKGAVAAKIAHHFQVHVRTGGPNAGHTYYIDWGQERQKIVARSVPCGAINKDANLVIGPGGLLDIDLLLQEVKGLDKYALDVAPRLVVDSHAIVINPTWHHATEGGVEGSAHQKIGSTGEGIGVARMAHINRTAIFSDMWTRLEHAGDGRIRDRLEDAGIRVMDDTGHLVATWEELGANVLLEGTQGSGLSSVHGPWPYVTSADTNSGQLLVDAGISPRRFTRCILVARTFPIRVAGNSGPLENETTWEELGFEQERTTVTKKVRRVGNWDDQLVSNAVALNGPYPALALTFADYIDPDAKNVTDWDELPHRIHDFVEKIEREHDVEVMMVGTGPDSIAHEPRSRWGE